MPIKKRLACGDCLEKMKSIPDNSVDMVMTDPPYGITGCKWDSVIPLEPMWEQLKRIIKPQGSILLMANEPFTSVLIASNLEMFKYCWYWQKERAGNFQLAKSRPMRILENVCVFYSKLGKFNHQGLIRFNRMMNNDKSKSGSMGHLNSSHKRPRYRQEFVNYPLEILAFKNEKGKHESQKPVALMKYLIKTYTDEGDVVLDFTMGSGTTGVACVLTGRDFIGIEREPKYFETAKNRIEGAKSKVGFGFV